MDVDALDLYELYLEFQVTFGHRNKDPLFVANQCNWSTYCIVSLRLNKLDKLPDTVLCPIHFEGLLRTVCGIERAVSHVSSKPSTISVVLSLGLLFLGVMFLLKLFSLIVGGEVNNHSAWGLIGFLRHNSFVAVVQCGLLEDGTNSAHSLTILETGHLEGSSV